MPQHIWHLHEWGAAATARCGHFQYCEIYMAQQWWRPIDSRLVVRRQPDLPRAKLMAGTMTMTTGRPAPRSLAATR